MKEKKLFSIFKIESVFYRAILLLLAFFSILGILGTSYKVAKVSFESNFPIVFVFLSAITMTAFLFVMIPLFFKAIDHFSERKTKLFTVLCFGGMTIIFAILILSYRIVPTTDSLIDIDIAKYLTIYDHIDKTTPLSFYASIYPNNYFFILLCKSLLKFFSSLSEFSVLKVLYIINAILMMIGTFFMWKTIHSTSSLAVANKSLLLFVLNPLPYFFIFWFYTNALSLPIISILIYIFVSIEQTDSSIKKNLLILMSILFSFGGYKLRATNIFPLVAYIIYIFFKRIQQKKFFEFFRFISIFLIIFFLLSKIASNYENNFFPSDIRNKAYPLTSWLVIGSSGHGMVSDADDHFQKMSECKDTAEMSTYCKKQLIDNYKNLGFMGTLKLMGIKYAITWSAGYADIDSRIEPGETDSSLSHWFSGDMNYLFRLYCNVFRIITFIGLFRFCTSTIKNNKSSNDSTYYVLNFLSSVICFGAILFYLFWEAKTSYSFPFLIPLIYMAQIGFSEHVASPINIFSNVKTLPYAKYIPLSLIALLCVFSIPVYKSKSTYNDNRISAIQKNIQLITLDGNNINQTFYLRKDFNNITIASDYLGRDDNYSEYTLKLKRDNDNIVLEKRINPSDIHDGHIVLNFPVIHEKDDTLYSMTIEKLDPNKESLLFYTYDTNYYSNYRGNLNCDNKSYNSDILLKISYIH